MIPSSNHASQAKRFSKYFVYKIDQIGRNTDIAPDPSYTQYAGSSFSAFKQTAKEVEELSNDYI